MPSGCCWSASAPAWLPSSWVLRAAAIAASPPALLQKSWRRPPTRQCLKPPGTKTGDLPPAYAAPEQWRSEHATPAIDVYALGVIGYELLAGQTPFTGPTAHEYRRQHLTETPPPIKNVPTEIQSLLSECLYKSPQARPQLQNLFERLRQKPKSVNAAAQQLQEANAISVERRDESERIKSFNRSNAERRAGLREAAIISLKNRRTMRDHHFC